MKNHLKKIAVFIINAAIVLIGVFFIRNYEKNKNAAADTTLDVQSQVPEFEANLSGPSGISSEENATSIVNEAVNQADSSSSTKKKSTPKTKTS